MPMKIFSLFGKIADFELSVAEHSVVAVFYPLAYHKKLRIFANGLVFNSMAMAENKKVVVFLLQFGLAEHRHLVGTALLFYVFLAFAATAQRPFFRYRETHPRVQCRESALAQPRGEDAFQSVVRFVHLGKSVAVADEQQLAIYLELSGLSISLDSKFLFQIVEHPHIVVAGEKMYLHPAVGEFGQLAEHTHEASRHHMFVRKPEIEDVAEQEKFVAVGFHLVEPAHEIGFASTAVGRCTEMGVGNEICFFG